MDKEKELAKAEVIDSYRLFPRFMWIIVAFCYFWFAYNAFTWIIAMPVLNELAIGFVGVTLTTLGGVLTLVTNKYFETGRKWKND